MVETNVGQLLDSKSEIVGQWKEDDLGGKQDWNVVKTLKMWLTEKKLLAMDHGLLGKHWSRWAER